MLLSLQGTAPPAILALADGTVFTGNSIGAAGQTVGEVVFNTSMTGYQEILTDPSYCQQIVTLTYPHIGNYGVNPEDVESRRVFAAGLIVKDLALHASNFRQTQTLSAYLQAAGTVAIANIDTRQLTRHLRTHGAQNGCIVALQAGQLADAASRQAAMEAARAAPSMAGLDLARVVSATQSYDWTQTEWTLGAGYGAQTQPRFHVVAYDFGIKSNILRMLAQRGCKVTVVPAQTSAADVLALQPDGIFLSNGPGEASGWPWKQKAGWSVRSRPCSVPSNRLIWVARRLDGSVSASTAKPWFWLVMLTRPLARSFTGWLAPWWPNFILKVLAPEASAMIWWPRQMPKVGVPDAISVWAAAIA